MCAPAEPDWLQPNLGGFRRDDVCCMALSRAWGTPNGCCRVVMACDAFPFTALTATTVFGTVVRYESRLQWLPNCRRCVTQLKLDVIAPPLLS